MPDGRHNKDPLDERRSGTSSGCVVKTLAAETRTTRNGLYTTYSHHKDEFEAQRERQRKAGVTSDPRQAQIARLKPRSRRCATATQRSQS